VGVRFVIDAQHVVRREAVGDRERERPGKALLPVGAGVAERGADRLALAQRTDPPQLEVQSRCRAAVKGIGTVVWLQPIFAPVEAEPRAGDASRITAD